MASCCTTLHAECSHSVQNAYWEAFHCKCAEWTDQFLWYFWRWFSQYLACPHIPSMPVNDCLTSQLQSHVMSIDCTAVLCVCTPGVGLLVMMIWRELCTSVAAVVTTTSVTPIKCRMETFWYRLTQVYLEKWLMKQGERASGCVVHRGCEWSYTVCAEWSPVRFSFANDSHENGWLIRAPVTSRLKHNNCESDGKVFFVI